MPGSLSIVYLGEELQRRYRMTAAPDESGCCHSAVMIADLRKPSPVNFSGIVPGASSLATTSCLATIAGEAAVGHCQYGGCKQTFRRKTPDVAEMREQAHGEPEHQLNRGATVMKDCTDRESPWSG